MEKIETRGRKPKRADELRDRKLEIRLSEIEEGQLVRAADGNLSTWAREILLRAAKRAAR